MFLGSQQTLDAERFFENWQRNLQNRPDSSPAGDGSVGGGPAVMADLHLSESDSDYDDVT